MSYKRKNKLHIICLIFIVIWSLFDNVRKCITIKRKYNISLLVLSQRRIQSISSFRDKDMSYITYIFISEKLICFKNPVSLYIKGAQYKLLHGISEEVFVSIFTGAMVT